MVGSKVVVYPNYEAKLEESGSENELKSKPK